MPVIYGWKTYTKIDKVLGIQHCTNCGHDEEMVLAREIFKIHIFWIPVFFKTKKRFVMCRNCGIVEELSKVEYEERVKEL